MPKVPLAPVQAYADWLEFGEWPFAEPAFGLPAETMAEFRLVHRLYEHHKPKDEAETGNRMSRRAAKKARR